MTSTEHFLSSDISLRQPSMTTSSTSVYGLGSGDVIKHGLVAPLAQSEVGYAAHRQTLAEQLFQALVDVKVWTSQIAMRLDLSTRDRVFRQLDRLHDCEEWFDGDGPVRLASYQSFIRFMLVLGTSSKPSLALAPNGNLLAVWEASGNRLTIEFLELDQLRWTVSSSDGDRTAGRTELSRIKDRLAPYNAGAWFSVG